MRLVNILINSSVQVIAGRYNNASEVVREGLHLVEERETRLKALMEYIDTAIELGNYSDEDLAKILAADTLVNR